MRWLRFTHQGQPAWGCLNDDTISVHTGDLFGIHQPTGQTLLLSQVSLLSPCQPGKFFALWNNFRAAAAKNQWAEPTEPLYFLKAANSFSIQVPKSCVLAPKWDASFLRPSWAW